MPPNPLLPKLIENTYSLSQLVRRLRSLRFYLQNRLYGPEETQLPETVDEKDLYWLVSLGENFYENFTKKNMSQQLEELANEIKKIKPLVIYIAFDLPDLEMEEIGKTLRKKQGNNFFIEIKHDPELIAGAAFVWNGELKDYSLRQTIHKNQKMILEKLRESLNWPLVILNLFQDPMIDSETSSE